jgi:hypothetical protein
MATSDYSHWYYKSRYPHARGTLKVALGTANARFFFVCLTLYL